jgi:hypothetical protein
LNYKPEISNFSQHRYPLDLTPALLFPSLQKILTMSNQPFLSLAALFPLAVLKIPTYRPTDLSTYHPEDSRTSTFPTSIHPDSHPQATSSTQIQITPTITSNIRHTRTRHRPISLLLARVKRKTSVSVPQFRPTFPLHYRFSFADVSFGA